MILCCIGMVCMAFMAAWYMLDYDRVSAVPWAAGAFSAAAATMVFVVLDGVAGRGKK